MKKITFSLVVAALSLAATTASFAQERKAFGRKIKAIHPTTGIVRCVSSEYEEYLQEIDPKRATNEQFEQWIAPKVAEIQEKRLSGRNVNAVITIPVVVHVIHNGQAVGNNANISDARVLSQITVLNEDYRRMAGTPGFNTNAVGADVEIQFCLAQRKPDGTATNGINRVNYGTASFSTYSSLQNGVKPSTVWDSSKYLNIWVVQFSDNLNTEMGGTLGYAQFPSNSGQPGLNANEGGANTDGVVIDWRCFGSSVYSPSTGNANRYDLPYDRGRTATHEVGHFLGLRHIWGDAGNRVEGVDCSGTDYCADTPVAGWDNYDCDQIYDSCPSSPGNDMTENYMDYSNDECMNIFTQNQKDRIIAVMNNSPRRISLKSSNACEAPLSTPSFEMLQGIKLYPNPANDVLNIATGADILPDAYKIYNSLGQIVAQKEIGGNADLQVNTSNFSKGVYIIKISKDNESKAIQFVKN